MKSVSNVIGGFQHKLSRFHTLLDEYFFRHYFFVIDFNLVPDNAIFGVLHNDKMIRFPHFNIFKIVPWRSFGQYLLNEMLLVN